MQTPKLAILLALAMAAAMVNPSEAQNTPQDYVSPHNRINDCKLQHSGGPYGENIFWGSAGADWKAADAVNAWVGEKQDYDYGSNTCAAGKVCGHYTQVVWRASTSIGCARVVCNNNLGVFITCNYEPRGNIIGQKPY
ncbi:unnamed protein product [Triticum turgidum subsp. durum]|uniref:SCP domain-containing protein n=1 Tax=Triticum turgidum subsp. durum TaxID=4567 RepID=A0A9R1BKN5_TRITD|nr:unnamed protein product [Triticum turgidum subsp. durum]